MSGWPIEKLPSDALLNFWLEIQKRKAAEINALNYASAYVMANHQTEDKKPLDYTKWLPYKIEKAAEEEGKPTIPDRAIAIIEANRNRLPRKMLGDLYRNKIIKQN